MWKSSQADPTTGFFLNHLGVLGMAGGRNKEERFLLQVKPDYREKKAPVRFEASTELSLTPPCGGRDVSQNKLLIFGVWFFVF